MSDAESIDASGSRYFSLEELSTLAHITPRTVRYYITERLLPPPCTMGRRATYGQEHLDRLRAINVLKEMYLPLREIRKRLDTLTPQQMRDSTYLATRTQAVVMDRALDHRQGREIGKSRQVVQTTQREDRDQLSMAVTRPSAGNRASSPSGSIRTWERFPLGNDAELLLRSSKVERMGAEIYRILYELQQMIDAENTDSDRHRS